MSDSSAFGFGKFVPGFDFLQNLSNSAAQAAPGANVGAVPGMASWVAPTLSIEDIDKRIQELKSVLFWLEQNTTALKATIQAMEVQKMTLTTLQSMNVNMADLAKAFTVKPPVAEPKTAAPTSVFASAPAPAAAPRPSLFTPKAAPEAQPEPAPPAQAEATVASPSDTGSSPNPAAPVAVDPMQWWGALTQQFQGIAAAALKDVAGEAMKAGQSAKAAKAKKTAKTSAGKATDQAFAAPRRTRSTPSSTSVSSAKPARAASASKPGAARKTSPQSTAKTTSK